MKPLLSKEEIAELLSPLTADAEQGHVENDGKPLTTGVLQLRAEAGRGTIDRRELQRLARGSIVLLERKAGEPLELYIDDHLVARGVLLQVKGKLAVKLTDVSVPVELIDDMP